MVKTRCMEQHPRRVSRSPITRKNLDVPLTTEQTEMLKTISLLDGWGKRAYTLLAENNPAAPHQHRWNKMLTKYYADKLSDDGSNNARIARVDETLIQNTAFEFTLSDDFVRSVIARVNMDRYELLTIEEISKHIPPTIRNRLINHAGQEQYVSLCLRYYLTSNTEGLFLSIDGKVYDSINKSSQLPFVEGFASPFNCNIFDSYCSLFVEDVAYGAWPRFDVMVDYIDFPCRFCLNPPYTPAVLEICINKLLNYMARQRGEFILMMPEMVDFEPLDRLLKWPNTRWKILKHGEYTLHSFFSGIDIAASMSLYLIANIGGNAAESEDVLKTLAYHLRQKACNSILLV